MDQVEPTSQGSVSGEAEFSAVLTPHRSLSPHGFLTLMAIVSAISFSAGMAFLLAGAWPVFGFFGLDVALIYFAFKINFRSGRAYETVSIAGSKLTVTKVLPSGRSRSWTLNPYWARVELSARPGRASRLLLTSHGHSLVLGAFLTEEERVDFAACLRDAIAASKGQAAT